MKNDKILIGNYVIMTKKTHTHTHTHRAKEFHDI